MKSENGIFKTINKIFGPYEFKEKNSKFISLIFPVLESFEADTILKALKKRYHDSTHVCFAYRLGNGVEDYFRYSDDGEPSGTAGIPIYSELKGAGLFNALIAVVRYYGGIKLGTGGLVKAYSKSAKNIINSSTIKTEKIMKRVEIDLPFELMGEIMKMVDKYSVTVKDQKFDDKGVKITLDIPETSFAKVRDDIRNVTKGKINI